MKNQKPKALEDLTDEEKTELNEWLDNFIKKYAPNPEDYLNLPLVNKKKIVERALYDDSFLEW